MTATHINQITDKMIADRLGSVRGVSVEWLGSMPANAETFDTDANAVLTTVTVHDVRKAAETHDLRGDTPLEEIDMAISIACEPDGMPDNGCVGLIFDN